MPADRIACIVLHIHTCRRLPWPPRCQVPPSSLHLIHAICIYACSNAVRANATLATVVPMSSLPTKTSAAAQAWTPFVLVWSIANIFLTRPIAMQDAPHCFSDIKHRQFWAGPTLHVCVWLGSCWSSSGHISIAVHQCGNHGGIASAHGHVAAAPYHRAPALARMEPIGQGPAASCFVSVSEC